MLTQFTTQYFNNERKEAQIGYPTSKTPINGFKRTPDIKKWIVENRNVGFNLCSSNLACQKSIDVAQSVLNKVFDITNNQYIVPQNAVTVAICASNNFTVGKHCQEFELIQGMRKEAYFTYRKISRRVVATYYNSENKEWLAGTSYYMHLSEDEYKDIRLDLDALTFCHGEMGVIYPEFFHTKCPYRRYCKTKKCMVSIIFSKGMAYHHIFNFLTRESLKEACVECNNDAIEHTMNDPSNNTEAKRDLKRRAAEAMAEMEKTAMEIEYDFGEMNLNSRSGERDEVDESEYDFGDIH